MNETERKKEIQEILGPQLNKLLETYEDIRTLEDLVKRGVVLKVMKGKELPPSKSKDEK